jgi:hypothetical protein
MDGVETPLSGLRVRLAATSERASIVVPQYISAWPAQIQLYIDDALLCSGGTRESFSSTRIPGGDTTNATYEVAYVEAHAPATYTLDELATMADSFRCALDYSILPGDTINGRVATVVTHYFGRDAYTEVEHG